jgi:hypothetical protein
MYVLGLSSNTFMEDEINIALASTDNWQKWGGHYARSLLSAHVNRECNNFLDKSVQQYQHCHSPEWIKNRDDAHTIFKSLPAPKPTIHYRGSIPTGPRLRNLASYSQQSNGCLHEDSKILLVDGRSIKCKNAIPGMEVVTYVINEGVVQKNTDSIECIVKTECNKTTFIQLPDSDCKITEWHPVILQKYYQNTRKCEFPINIGEVVHSVSAHVYTFVLKNRSHAISISGWPCITLGHNLKEEIAKHEFWGTENVINCLKDFPEWDSGVITLQNENFIRKIGPDGPRGEVLYISPILR